MITVHDLLTKCWAHVRDKNSEVCIQTIRINIDGNPEVYTKKVQGIFYDHKNRKLILK